MTTVTWSNRPDRLPLEVTAGLGFNGELIILEADGTAMDLTGATMTAVVARNPGASPTTLFTPTVTIVTAADGHIRMTYTQGNGETLYGAREPVWWLLKDGAPLFDGPVVPASLGESGVTRFRTGQTTTVQAAAVTGGGGSGDLEAANNLSDLDDAATARTNLGLGTAATTAASAYATAAQGATADTATQPATGEPASAVMMASANLGVGLAIFDRFNAHTDGSIHDVDTIGHGTHDPETWVESQAAGANAAFVEECQIVSGVLRHRGTRLVAAATMPLMSNTRHTVSVEWAEPTAGPGGGYPSLPVAESGYASLRILLIDTDVTAGDGYVCYVEQADDTANHFIKIVRDDNQIPTDIVGPVDLGRRLDDGELLTFCHDGNTFAALVGGVEICRVTESTYTSTTFDSVGIVLNTESLWLPGCKSFAISLGVPPTFELATDIATESAARAAADTANSDDITAIETALAATPIKAASFNEANGFELIGDWESAAAMSIAPGEIYASRHQTIPRTWSQYGLCITTASGTPGDVLLQAIVAVGTNGEIGAVIQQGSHDANAADSDGSYIVEDVDLPWEFWHVVYAPDSNTGTPQVYGGLPRNGGGPATWSSNGINRAGSVSNTATTGGTLPDMTGYVFDNTSPTGNRLRIETTSAVPVFGGRG